MNTLKTIILLTGLSLCSACNKNNDAEPGTRKTYLTIHRHGSGYVEYTYDSEGRLTGETDKGEDGVTDVHRTYSRFSSAGMPERIDYTFPASPFHKPYYTIEYDAQARPVKLINHATDGSTGPYDTYTYFTNRIEFRTFNAGGTEQYLHVYTLDHAENLLTIDYQNRTDGNSWKVSFTGYDNKKAPVHPYKYLAIALMENPNFISANNYTGYETYREGTLEDRYSCTYTYHRNGYATSRKTSHVPSGVSLEEFFEFIDR